MTLRPFSIAALLSAAVLAGCSDKDPELMNFAASRTGPDEFLVNPAKPLEKPTATAALPAPTPGGQNRADATPFEDAVVALGGSASSLNRDGVPSSDNGLLAYTSRRGRDAGIRQTLAAEDLEFRRDNNGRLIERLANVNVYYRSYEDFSLDQQAEIERFRNAGIRTSSAPPALLYPE